MRAALLAALLAAGGVAAGGLAAGGAAADGAATAEEGRRMDAAEARRILAREGGLADAVVEGDLDLGGLAHPAGGALSLHGVALRGSLRGAPAAPLEVSRSEFGGLRAPRSLWRHPLTVERSVFTGRVGLDGARFEGAFACRRCRFAASVSARRARFGEEADLAFSEFAGIADFTAARFRGAGFDGARFTDTEGGGPLFDEADFAGPARFAGLDTGAAPAFFRGATFREEASFRGCRIGRAVFAPAPAEQGAAANPFEAAVTVFGGPADFRRCRFEAGADLAAAALRAGARFDGAALHRGLLDLRGLTQAGGEIVLRGLRLDPGGAAIAADEGAIGSVVADPALFAPAAWRDLSPTALAALAARAQALGAAVEGRRLAFAATTRRAAAPEAGWEERLAWALEWPTRNYTDLARPLLLGALAWLAAFLATLGPGALAAVAPEEGGGAARSGPLLLRVLDPLHLPLEAAAVPARHAWCPATARGRAAAAAAFGVALVFKLGSRRWRPMAAGGGWRPPLLAALWLAGFVLVALIGATALRLLPGLRELAGAIPG